MSKSKSKSLETEETRKNDNDMEALVRTPLLANIRTDSLRELLRGAERKPYPDGQKLEPPEGALYILIKGSLELRKKVTEPSRSQPSDSSCTRIMLTAPDVLGPFLSEAHPLRHYDVWTHGQETEILRVEDTFWQLFERDPDFQRAVLRHYLRFVTREPGALLRPTPFGRKANPSSPPPILVLRNGTGKRLPLGGLADLLAASVARQFDEHVRVLHFSPEVKTAGEYKAERQVVSDNNGVSGWVESEWLPLPESPEALEKTIIEAARSSTPETLIKDEVSLVVVDAGDTRFIPTEGEIDFVYLCDESICSPNGLPQELVNAQRSRRPDFNILYTGLLPESGKMAERTRTWPIGTVRLRFKSEHLQWLEQETRSPDFAARFAEKSRHAERSWCFTRTDDLIDHWARAVTGRRVGVALGGGGAYGYVHIALLRELRRAKVPVDLVSGSSFGTLVGMFYVTQAEEGLRFIETNWLTPTLSVLLGLVSNRPVGKLLDWASGNRRFDELDLPMFPVVADADSGSEWDLRDSRIGDGTRASGALPPLAPAIIEDRTYLDGGVVANVPVHVLQDEGAGLVIASNCITDPRLRPRRPGPTWLNMVRETLSPRRLQDLYRMTLLMMRGAGNNQAQCADVVYEPPPSELRNPAQFGAGPEQVKKATDSVALAVAVEKTLALRKGLRRHGAGMVRLTDTGTLVVDPPLRFTPGEATFQTSDEGKKAEEIPAPLQSFFAYNNSLAFTLVVPANTAKLAQERALTLKEQLVKAGISLNQLSLAWNQKGEEVSFRDVRWLSAELRNQLLEADRQLHRVAECLLAGDLAEAWSLACTMGESLKTPTARRYLRALDPSLRQLLASQGRPVPVLETTVGTQAFYVVWCDDGRLRKNDPLRDDRLAIGGDDGLQLWTRLTTGKARSDCYTSGTVAGLAWHPAGRLACTTFKELLVFTPPDAGVLGTPVEGGDGGWERWGTTFSADGSQVLSSTGSRNLVRFPAEAPSQGQIAHGLERKVKRAVTSPTGGWTAAVTMDGNLLLWHGDLTSNPPSTLLGRGAECLEWHSTYDVLAVGTERSVELFDLRGSDPALRAPTLVAPRSTRLDVPGPVGQVAWAPVVNEKGAERLAALGADVRIWDDVISGSGELVMVLQPEAGIQIGMQWHPEGEYLATWNAMATVWSVRSGRVVAHYGGAKAQLAMAAWSPTGRYLALCGREGKVRIWEPGVVGLLRYSHEDPGAGALEFPKTRPLTCAYWHPAAGNCVASASADGSVQLWDPLDKLNRTTWSRLLEPVSPPSPSFAAWSSDGQRLATVQADELKVWSFLLNSKTANFTQPTPDQTMVLGFTTRSNPAGAASWLRWCDDQQKLTICNGREIQVWDVVRAKLLWRWQVEHDDQRISWANWSPDGNQLAVAVLCGDSPLVLWSAAAPDRMDRHPVSKDGLWDVAFSPNGKWIAIGCNDKMTMILNAATREVETTLTNELAIRNLAWSPDSKLLAICNDAYKVDIYDTQTWKSVLSPITEQPTHEVTELLWRAARDAGQPEGEEPLPLLLLLSTQGGEVLAWSDSPGGWEQLSVLAEANGKEVDCISLSPDGKHLVISGAEGVARVLPVDTEILLDEVSKLPWKSSDEQAPMPRDLDEDEGNEAAA